VSTIIPVQNVRNHSGCTVTGLSNKAIARDYGISPRTVEVYRANVMTKMQATNLSELVRLAMRAGVLKD